MRRLNLLFQHILFLMFLHFQKYLSPQVRTKKLINSVFLPPLFFKISLRDKYIHLNFSLNSLGFYLSRMLIEFSLTCISQHVWEKIFNLWCSHSQRIIESRYAFLLMPQSSTQNSWLNFLKICFPKTEGVEEAMICCIKIQSENMKMTWNISLFPFGMIAIFLNVMALQFPK